MFRWLCTFVIVFRLLSSNNYSSSFLLATHESAGNLDLFLPNAIALAIILIAKSPAMHKVRILGINKD